MKNLNTNLGLLFKGIEKREEKTIDESINFVDEKQIQNEILIANTIEKARKKVFEFFKKNREDFKKNIKDIKNHIAAEIDILNSEIKTEKINIISDGSYIRAIYGTTQVDNKKIRLCQMSTQNRKLMPNQKEGFLIWSILGKLTCNGKTELCAKSCYNNCRQDSNNLGFKIINLIFSLLDQKIFTETIEKIIEKTPHLITYVRIHEDGDFYDKEYFEKWVSITKKINVNFTAYTKEPTLITKINDINNNYPNLYLRYSIMEDTNPKTVEYITKNNIPFFACVGQKKNDKEIINFIESMNNNNRCFGSCQECKKCYIKGYNKIFVSMH